MNLYRLHGLITKSKEQDDIYVIARDVDHAIKRASSFATEIVAKDCQKLSKDWDRYPCN